MQSLVNPALTANLATEDRRGWYAEVRTGCPADGSCGHRSITDCDPRSFLQVSRLDGESGWTIDAAFASNGLPVWSNGYGARYLMTRKLTDETSAELDRTPTSPSARTASRATARAIGCGSSRPAVASRSRRADEARAMTRRLVRLRWSGTVWYISPLADDEVIAGFWQDRIKALVYAGVRGWTVVG